MKTIATAIILAVSCLFAGCETTSYEKGLLTGATAKIAFKSDSDREKFAAIKSDIEAFLESGQTLTEAIIAQYAEKVKADLSPAVIELVIAKLRAELRIDPSKETDANEFLRGLADAL